MVVPESVADPLRYYLNNTVKSRALIEVAVKSGIRHFIFSSTAAVYGMTGDKPVAEDAPLRPLSPYGSSKLMTEIMLADAGRAHGLPHVILRYFNVAGADPQGRAGQSTPYATHLIKVACETAVGMRGHMEVFGTDYPTRDGTCLRDYIHVADLAHAHMAALRHLRAGGASDVFNCGYGRGVSVPRGDRDGEAGLGERLRGAQRPAPARRSGGGDRRPRQDPQGPRLGTEARQPRCHG